MQKRVSFIEHELQQDYLQEQRSLTWIKIWWISYSTDKMNEILLQTPSKYVFLPLTEASLLLCCPSLINWKHIIINENSDRAEVETCFLVMSLQPKHKKQFCLCRKSNPLLLHYPIDLKSFTSPLLTSCQSKFHNRSGTPLQVHLKRSSVNILFLPLSFVHCIS